MSSANAPLPVIAEKANASNVDPSSAKPSSAPRVELQDFLCFADLVIPAVAFEATEVERQLFRIHAQPR